MTETAIDRALLAAPPKPVPPVQEQIVRVARDFKTSPFKQFTDMMKLWIGKNRLGFHEYYSNQLYRPELGPEGKYRFVGEKGSYKLNNRLSPKNLTVMRPFVRDKVLYSAMLQQMGIRTTETQAMVSKHRRFGSLPTLSTADAVADFLRNTAKYPLFAKPEVGSGSVGSALIQARDADTDTLHLSNGSTIAVSAFANEVLEDYGEGFILQSAVIQHPDLVAMAGQAVGTIRVVTVIEDDAPRILYTLWKIPAPSAMSDNYWQDGSMLAEIDAGTGALKQCRRGAGPDQEVIETHPVSGLSFGDFTMPHWDELVRMTTQAHAILPEFGVFGWDIAMTGDGPLIIECNANPHHMLYQLATGNGIYNAAFEPVLDRVAARAQRLLEDIRDKQRAKNAAKRQKS